MITKNPWRGLASYEEPQGTSDDYLFCGRDEETMDMVRLIDNNLFITLYGSSGIGKTSLLKAGVIPILKRRDYYPLYVRLSQEPTEISYAEAIVKKLQNSDLKEERSIALEHADGNDRLYLWNYFATTRFRNANEREVYPVIILDQFEEVFRDADKQKAELLLQQIYLLLNDELEMPNQEGYNDETNYRFVASIREDFLFVLEDSIDEFSLDLYKNNRYRLRPMKPENARQVVLMPGKDCIEEIEKEKVAERVIELSKNNSKNAIDTLLLSLVCASTFDKKPETKLSRLDFEFWGNNPMRVYYQEAIKQLKTDQVRYIQNNLINKDGSRRRVQMQVLKTNLGEDIYDSLLKGAHRILTLTADGQLELLHDQIALTIFEDRDAYEERERNWKFMEMQSRLVVERTKALADENPYLAQLLLLEILPTNISHPNRPFLIEAEFLLRKATSNPCYSFPGLYEVISAMFSPNGDLIISTGTSKAAVWNPRTGSLLFTLEGHSAPIKSGCFSHDGKRIVTASNDRTVRIWEASNGHLVHVLIGHKFVVQSAYFSPDDKHIVSASWDKTIKIWNAQSGDLERTLTGHSNSVLCATYSPNSKQIASASSDHTIMIWDVKTGLALHTLHGHTDVVYSVDYSPDGQRIVSAGDTTLKIWDAKTGVLIRNIEAHNDQVLYVTYSMDGKFIASTSKDSTIKIWDAEDGVCLQVLDTSRSNTISFNQNSKQVVSAGGGMTIWTIKPDYSHYHRMQNIGIRRIGSLFINPNGKQLLRQEYIEHSNGGKNKEEVNPELVLRDGKTGDYISNFGKHISDFNFSPNGRWIVTAYDDNTIRIWDAVSRECIKTFIVNSQPIHAICFNPDGSQIVSTETNAVRIWCSTTGELLHSFEGTDFVTANYSNDGKKIISVSIKNIDLSKTNKDTEITRLSLFDYGSKTFIVHLQAWDVVSGSKLFERTETIEATNISVRLSGTLVLLSDSSFDFHSGVLLWNVETNKETILHISSSLRSSFDISHDGKRLVQCDGFHNYIQVSDIDTGDVIQTFVNIDTEDVIFSLDDRNVLYSTPSGKVGVLYCPPLQELIDQTRERFKDRPLTAEERRMYYLE